MPPQGIKKSRDELVEMLRAFLGDTPESNKLIEDKEIGDDKLRLALDLALDEYNNAPPFENRSFETFPSLIVIIHGGAIQALIMAGLIQTRNYLNFSDGGIQEVLSDKAQGYQSWIGQLVSAYKSEVLNIKTALNMEENFGIIGSPYGNAFDSDFS
jgi:hypothetical protein